MHYNILPTYQDFYIDALKFLKAILFTYLFLKIIFIYLMNTTRYTRNQECKLKLSPMEYKTQKAIIFYS